MKTTTPIKHRVKRKSVSLDDSEKLKKLARDIRQGHKDVGQANARAEKENQNSLRNAILVGQWLTEAKAIIGHGAWLAWLAKHCRGVSQPTAWRYMQLANHSDLNNLVKNGNTLQSAYIITKILKPDEKAKDRETRLREKFWRENVEAKQTANSDVAPPIERREDNQQGSTGGESVPFSNQPQEQLQRHVEKLLDKVFYVPSVPNPAVHSSVHESAIKSHAEAICDLLASVPVEGRKRAIDWLVERFERAR